MNTRILLQLMGTGGLFATAFILLRVTVPAFGPILLIDLRVLLAALVLIGWAVATKHPLHFRGPWHRWFILGALNAAIPFTFVAWAELTLPASFAAVSVAAVPIITAIAAALRLREPLTVPSTVGLLLGFGGVVLISGGSALAWNASTLTAVVALMASAVSYAAGAIYIQTEFRDVPRTTLTIGNLLAAGILLAPVALGSLPSVPPSSQAVIGLVALAVASTALAFRCYFRLIESVGATTASIATFFVPGFAALMGAGLLGEHISVLTGAGMVAVAAGAACASRVSISLPWFRAKAVGP